ncbi:hypothetical protein [Rhodanobacter sp. Root179]|uniref:hypothetical protein n=1 Tax=Rhodanobacter sp. Root179 TaxID=1736482 RepID=UPI0012F961C7|nr:hypothetical protein [Rhodanobacter sp. Root179]
MIFGTPSLINEVERGRYRRKRMIALWTVTISAALLFLGCLLIPGMFDALMAFLRAFFTILIISVVVFVVLLLAGRDLGRQSGAFAFVGAALTFVFLCGYSIFHGFQDDVSASSSASVVSDVPYASSVSNKRPEKSKTVYLENYRQKGDTQAIRCEEIGGQVECHAAK